LNPYRIVLADDHVLLRQGLKKILEVRDDLRVVGEAGDGLELLELLKETTADMVILDISMPHLSGIEAAQEIRRRHPGMKILVLSMYREYLFRAVSAKVDGYLLKENADTELFSAIEKIRQGGSYVSPDLSETLIDRVVEAGRRERQSSPETQMLTRREREVLSLVAEGKSSRDIAERLSIGVRTAEHHRANIMKKMNATNTVDLLKRAAKKGYI
jgi:DNA-binding NarL/FixJ family response regulator